MNPRSRNTWKHVFLSFGGKGISIVVSLALIPLAIKILGEEQYGVWITISSVLTWFGFMDIGIGNGLRNKLVKTLAKNDIVEARQMISTAYISVSIIFFLLLFVFWFVNPFINWAIVFNTSSEYQLIISKLVFIVFSLFILQFILKLIGNVFFAFQLASYNNYILPTSNLLILIVLFLMYKLGNDISLLTFGIIFSVFPIVAYFLATILFFSNKKYKQYKPSIKFFKISLSKELLVYGSGFLIMQIGALIMTSTTNILITQFYSPVEVTKYNIAFRYFSTVRMIFLILLVPFWSAVTDAYVRKDFHWIIRSYKKLTMASFLFIGLLLIAGFISKSIFNIWVKDVIIPNNIIIATMVFVAVFLYTDTLIIFLNGIGKIKLQTILSFVVIIFNIVIAIGLNNTALGIAGLIIAPGISRLIKFIPGMIQYSKLINNKANGIWAK